MFFTPHWFYNTQAAAIIRDNQNWKKLTPYAESEDATVPLLSQDAIFFSVFIIHAPLLVHLCGSEWVMRRDTFPAFIECNCSGNNLSGLLVRPNCSGRRLFVIEARDVKWYSLARETHKWNQGALSSRRAFLWFIYQTRRAAAGIHFSSARV